MARLFRLALESSDLEGSVAGGGETLNETELEQNTEETVQEQNEIENGSQEVDEALEEADVLAEQAEVNNELIENPDATVTAADVEVSEEALKLSCYKLGITRYNKLSFASEHAVEDVRSNPRKYLKVSNEEISDTLKKIFLAIKNMIKQIISKIKRLYTKISIKFGNYAEQLKRKLIVLEELDPKSVNVDSLSDLLAKSDNCNLQFALLNNAPETLLLPSNDTINFYKILVDFVSQFKNPRDFFDKIGEADRQSKAGEEVEIEKILNGASKLFDKIGQSSIVRNASKDDVDMYGYIKRSNYIDSSDDTKDADFNAKFDHIGVPKAINTHIVGNNKLAYFDMSTLSFRYAKLEVDRSKLANAKVNPGELIKNVLAERKYPEGFINNIKLICDNLGNLENTAMKILDAIEALSKIVTREENIRVIIRAIKSAAIDFGMFILNTAISQLKDYIKLVGFILSNSPSYNS